MARIVGYSGNNPIKADGTADGYDGYGSYPGDIVSLDGMTLSRATIPERCGLFARVGVIEKARTTSPEPDPAPPTAFAIDKFIFTDDYETILVTTASETPDVMTLSGLGAADLPIAVGDKLLWAKEQMSAAEQPIVAGVYVVTGAEVDPVQWTLERVDGMRVGEPYTWANIDSPQGAVGTLYRAAITSDEGTIGTDLLTFDFFLVPVP